MAGAALSVEAGRLHRGDLPAMTLASALLVVLTAAQLWPIGWMEVFGFVSGGVCVWLIVREHPWTWPVGMLNNLVFFAMFWDARLYADMSLQALYFTLAAYGWWQWLHGGGDGGVLEVSRTGRGEWIALGSVVPVATLGLHWLLVAASDAAPWADAFTTALCLAAQYLLTRKRIENWAFWIAADAVYVPMYLSRDLPLTALLYAVLLAMCLVGWRTWLRSAPTGVPA